MIKTAIICFTKKGTELAKRIAAAEIWADGELELYAKYESFDKDLYSEFTVVEDRLSDWALGMMKKQYAIIFIGAMGIAVRAIAGGLENKLVDAPVIVIDELGMNDIPVVGGHVGGANEMALSLAECLGSNPVITTATDLEGAFSVDLFAKENGLTIANKDGIAKVSAKALEGRAIRLSIQNYPASEKMKNEVTGTNVPSDEGLTDIIISSDKTMKSTCDILLCPKEYAVGIGCKKGTTFEALKEFLDAKLSDNGVDICDVGAIASIDLKEDEEGLVELCRFYRIPFITYTAELLEKASGEFEESDFVKEKTGVGNVCERAAMLLTNNQGTIVQKKCSENGMTLAIAKR